MSCPGTDTCKLGISSSRGLGGELRNRLLARSYQLDEAIKGLHVKVSGCFNSCGCHHVADIGFYGVSRTINGYKIPHFQVVLGGQWENNAGSYGLPIIAIPSKRAPEVVDRITQYFVVNRQKDEAFYAFVKRVGKGPIRALLEPLTQEIPTHESEPSFYSDWGDPRQYSIGDIGIGECAGEVVSRYLFEMTAAERLVFEAGLDLDRNAAQPAGETAYKAFLRAAKALVQVQYDDVSNDPDEIAAEFKERFFDTQNSSTRSSGRSLRTTSSLPMRPAASNSRLTRPTTGSPRRSSSLRRSMGATTACVRRRPRWRRAPDGWPAAFPPTTWRWNSNT